MLDTYFTITRFTHNRSIPVSRYGDRNNITKFLLKNVSADIQGKQSVLKYTNNNILFFVRYIWLNTNMNKKIESSAKR